MKNLVMQSRLRCATKVLFLVGFLAALPATAQIITTKSINLGSGNGVLQYQNLLYSKKCTVVGKFTYSYTQVVEDEFVFLPAGGGSIALPPGSFTINSGVPTGAPPPCPKDGVVSGHPLTLLEQNYEVYVYPSGGTVDAAYATGTFGYINPKYVVSTLMYAPPGSKSTAVYTNSSTVSSTTTVTETFTSSTTESVGTGTALLGAGVTDVTGWLNGTEVSTSSNTVTEQSQNSDSVTLTTTTSSGLEVLGPASDYVGVDHDYDVVRVWINPILLFTVYDTTVAGETKVGWWGYGWSALDTTAPIDIWPIPIGCLNGDIAATASACAPALKAFKRPWAASENWPSGQGPGLTAADLANILASDPWGSCKPSDPVGSSACPNYTAGFLFPNFALSDQTDMAYTQAAPGGQPAPEGPFSVSTTNSEVETTQTTATYSQTYGYEEKLSAFFGLFTLDSTESQTLTWSNMYNSSLTQTSTKTGTVTIIPPACSGNPCNPSYPPATETFGTATAFDIFIDYRFGTFAFLPSAY